MRFFCLIGYWYVNLNYLGFTYFTGARKPFSTNLCYFVRRWLNLSYKVWGKIFPRWPERLGEFYQWRSMKELNYRTEIDVWALWVMITSCACLWFETRWRRVNVSDLSVLTLHNDIISSSDWLTVWCRWMSVRVWLSAAGRPECNTMPSVMLSAPAWAYICRYIDLFLYHCAKWLYAWFTQC